MNGVKLLASVVFAVLAVLPFSVAFGGPTVWQWDLETVERQALDVSPAISAVRADAQAAAFRASSQSTLLLPRLVLDVSTRYVSVVPEIGLQRGIPPIPFGDNLNYSIGPALQWNAWDSLATYHAWQAAGKTEVAKREEVRAREQDVLLSARNGYFAIQLSLERVRLITDSLRVAYAQYRDIDRRVKAGAASRADLLSSHQQVLVFQQQLDQARADLASAIQDVTALTGAKPDADLTAPMHEADLDGLPPDLQVPTVLVRTDGIAAAMRRLAGVERGDVGEEHPTVKALQAYAEASQYGAEAASAGHWPKILVSAKTSVDYPNGPLLQQIHQNTVSVAATWSIFEWGRVRDDSREKDAQAESLRMRRDQQKIDLRREWEKAKARLAALRAQRALNDLSIRETEEVAHLMYDSYKAGQTKLLDVQTANLRVLEAKVQAAQNDVQILMTLARMDSLLSGNGRAAGGLGGGKQ